MSEWKKMGDHPTDGTPFLIAQYAPTSWEYRVTQVGAPRYMIGTPAGAQFIERQTRYARAWMPLPEPPGPHGTGWVNESQ